MLSNLTAFRTLVASQNPTAPIRMALSDADAVELVAELTAPGGAGLPQHAQAVTDAAAAMAAFLGRPIPVEDADALQAWAEEKGILSRALWDGLQGSVVEGVEIVRKRAG